MELKSREVLKVKTISKGNKYNVDKDNKLFGKTYNLYQYDGTVFTVNSEDEFVSWKDEGKLYSADLKESTRQVEDPKTGALVEVRSFQLVGCTNIAQEKAMAETDAALNYIHTQYSPAKVDESLLASLA